MKTREEIEQEYQNNVEILYIEFGDKLREVAKVRDAELAELDDPMLRLLKEAKRALNCPFLYPAIQGDLRDAIDYAEQRRVGP